MKYKWLFSLLVASSMVLTSCMPNDSIEDVAIVQLAGYDYIDENQIKGTFAVAQYTKGEQKAAATEIYLTSTADTAKNIHANLQTKSSKPISTGKMSIALFNEELAKQDISKFIDSLTRDPRIGRDIFLAVVNGEAQGMIEGKYEQNETTARYIMGIIEHNMKRNFPNTNLHSFLHSYYGNGVDGFLPYLKKSKDFIKMEGIAFLDDSRLALTIPYSKSLFFKMMKEKVSEGVQEIQFQGDGIMIESINSKVEYYIEGGTENPKFLIDIRVTGVLNEISNLEDSSNPKRIHKMEKEFNEIFEKQCLALIQQFQENNIDPLGLGSILDNRSRNFDVKAWNDKYPDTPVDVKVTMDITETGISS
ncbi:Ger(x)C family spore germination protein [Halobacillus shinanisalinarum]|uniref:Ger(X)C family spore germination protein n=1 Tax=Halobacillus shinanisalinarum TaxID=2932258 RepID=A0ABY4GUS9_9BACI|nr:Ger(x)C family spore germination protein [Halobacillus shinanisalinarum]UOQ91653.1 Ger(x)C family spore germination protein [Halobacillus shinanisalinarum]